MATKNKSVEDSRKKNESINQWQQKVAEQYTYCMISTFNQMVNYLPILLFDFEQPKMYITISNSKQNKEFDKNIRATFDHLPKTNRFAMPEEFIEIADINSVSSIQQVLSEKIVGKKLLWNITGGQRPFIMAIFELLKQSERKNDIVIYLEGNTGQLVFLTANNNGQLEKIEPNEHGFERYDVTASNKDWLTIPIALKLMGFTDDKVKVKMAKKNSYEEDINYESFLTVEKAKKDALISLIEKYRTNECLRKKLLGLNKSASFNDGNYIYQTKAIFDKDQKEREEYFSELDDKEIELILDHKSCPYPFGHLLEELFAYAIWDTTKDDIADMGINIRLRFNNESVSNQVVDELDITVLTKTGQLAVFEVKSGDMHSDVAKSTKYTTYAIAGVYGKPVLLTPLLKEQCNDVGKLRDNWAYGASASAFQAARRAQLPIIGLDGNDTGNFEHVIKDLLNIK